MNFTIFEVDDITQISFLLMLQKYGILAYEKIPSLTIIRTQNTPTTVIATYNAIRTLRKHAVQYNFVQRRQNNYLWVYLHSATQQDHYPVIQVT